MPILGIPRGESEKIGIIRSTGITNLARPSFMDITKTDWDAYKAQLADNMTDLLTQSIMEAFNSATDLTYVSCKVKPRLWDTPAVKEARRDMRTKLRLPIKNKDSGYNKTKRESRQNYEKIRNHTWSTKFRDFCDKLEAKSDSKRISSLIKNNKNTQLGTVKKPDGSLTEKLWTSWLKYILQHR